MTEGIVESLMNQTCVLNHAPSIDADALDNINYFGFTFLIKKLHSVIDGDECSRTSDAG